MESIQRFGNKIFIHFILLISASLYLNGCAGWFGFPTYYDATTYKNLTGLKAEVIFLYNTFLDDDIDEKKIEAIRLKLAQIHEYEKGKGDKNKETESQIAIIKKMLDRHIKDRRDFGRWTPVHLANSRENIEEAFDIAIETENLKNKNE